MRCKNTRYSFFAFTPYQEMCKGIILMILCFCANSMYAQDKALAVNNTIGTIEAYHKLYPAEKLYIKFDKPAYAINDTVWFKAYLFDASSFTPSKSSGKLYIELINDSSIVVNRFVIPVKSGLGLGSIALNTQTIPGTYTLRAYTNWMQNFGADAFFTRQFYIGKTAPADAWLINEQHTVTSGANGNDVDLIINFTGLNKLPVSYRDIEVKLTDNKSTLFKNSYTTADNGNAHAKLTLPAKINTQQLLLVITDKITKKTFTTPFYPGGEMKNIDLQFMPEGGYLVAGLTNKVGFKAISDNGLGEDINGQILNQENQEVGTFSSMHNGMGTFWLVPKSNETYTANFVLNGVKRAAVLPAVHPSGIVLRVDNISNADSVYVHLTATPDVTAKNKVYSLIAQSAAGVYLGVSFDLQKGFNNIRLPKNTFLTGIVNFTVLDGMVPINERKIFIDHHDRLIINTGTSQNSYHLNDTVNLKLNVADALGKPVKGSFAVSVTDDNYIKTDTYQDNIISRLLLTSEIRGNIENPAWYFTGNANATPALDNVMLTQGWTAFDWSAAMHPSTSPHFLPEPDNSLTGKLTGLFNKPVKGAKVNLFAVSKKYGIVMIDTISDTDGNFKLRDLPLLDTISYTVRASTSKDKELGANIHLNEFKPTEIKLPVSNRQIPWYFTTDNITAVNYFTIAPPPAKLNSADVKGKLLNEVIIKSAKPIKWADFVPAIRKTINEKTLVNAANMNLRDLMNKEFNSLYIKDNNYVVGQHLLIDMIVDGQSLREWSGETIADMEKPNLSSVVAGSFREAVKSFLYNTSVADIIRVRISDGLTPYIVIETRGGKGVFTQTTPGMIAFHPVPYNIAKQYYKPVYSVKIIPGTPHPVICWEPNLITDEKGNATLNFYAADTPSTYTVTIEGTDMLGHFGAQTLKVSVNAKATASN